MSKSWDLLLLILFLLLLPQLKPFLLCEVFLDPSRKVSQWSRLKLPQGSTEQALLLLLPVGSGLSAPEWRTSLTNLFSEHKGSWNSWSQNSQVLTNWPGFLFHHAVQSAGCLPLPRAYLHFSPIAGQWPTMRSAAPGAPNCPASMVTQTAGIRLTPL